MISKPWDFANFKILYMYFKCVFNILLYCFMLLICDTKINNKIIISPGLQMCQNNVRIKFKQWVHRNTNEAVLTSTHNLFQSTNKKMM